ncbi:hypothetical protein RhiirA4_477297 [Rhizophagus irregularis]|uniref:Uncharacterized protein n=1 Tax=Rhizophagus irregularis TaxID=588596 RepID=A0A2I1HD15_9GLOM|nr:hypothetical protein RhiirA4_477297 [Rhizophagus irregularis]
MELWKTRLELIVFIETYQDHILHLQYLRNNIIFYNYTLQWLDEILEKINVHLALEVLRN